MFSIEKQIVDNKIILSGFFTNTLVNDIYRIFKVNPNDGKLFFTFTNTGMIFKKTSIIFHRYFALEIYNVFDKLYDITERYMYDQTLKLLKEEPNIEKYFSPMLELPSNVTDRLNQLSTKLFPFQEAFVKSYYNAKNKLGLHGYLLAFEQGLGKTFTAIATSYAFDMAPTIITAPLSTLDGWKKSILNMVPNIKDNEVKLIYEYNPNIDKVPWKYLICNYERLNAAIEYSKYATESPKSLLIDECHNFRYMNTNRSKNLLDLKESLKIKDVIAISGTPIKALAAELIPIMRIIDPFFDEEAESIFKRMYAKNIYDPIAGTVLKQRLDMFIERRKQEDSIKLPPKSRYTIQITLNNPKPYLVNEVKKMVWKDVIDKIPEYRKHIVPNYDKIKKLLYTNEKYNEVGNEIKEQYLQIVKEKIIRPMSYKAIESTPIIKEIEEKVLKLYDPDTTKEIVQLRRQCTSYIQILLGKAMGQYFIRGKINLIGLMVQENIDELVNIINQSTKKVIIFSTYVDPLDTVKNALENHGVGTIVHVGGDNIVTTRDIFKNDDRVKCLLGTTASIGTGTDGLQFIANTMIFLNQPYRSADTEQCEARIFRKGQDSPVNIYFMKLMTDQPNILEQEGMINEWSRAMTKIAID